jgi:putative transposase
MPLNPAKGHAALRRGRESVPHAGYFLTLCTASRQKGLTQALLANKVLEELRSMETNSVWFVRCATIMPDHIHLIITLGERLGLGKAVQRMKGKTAAALRAFGLEWENDFFDHQLRSDDCGLPLFLYVYLNPYRAGDCAQNVRWPWFVCQDEDWKWVQEYLEQELPLPEWLQ